MHADRGLVTGAVTARVTVPTEVSTQTLSAIATAITPLVPGGWQPCPEPPAAPQIHLDIAAGTPAVTVLGETVRIQLAADEVATSRLGYVTYTAVERARQQHGVVTAHANAVATPDGAGAVVLLGDKGSGKTSTSLTLAARGYPVLGDDLVLLSLAHPGSLRVVAGKRLARIRDPARGYEVKRTVALSDPPAGTGQVLAAVRVSVHPHVPVPRLASGTPLSITDRLRLHENFARYIAGLPTPLTLHPAVTGPVYLLDTPACVATRASIIDRLPLTYLHAPTAEAAADLIEELMTA